MQLHVSWMASKRVISGEDASPSSFRSAFDRDLGIISHSSRFRRLAHKTQVYSDPNNDFVRSRLTHSIEASQIGRELARMFLHVLEQKWDFLDHDFSRDFETLVATACLTHDIGHSAFGHAGEETLKKLSKDAFAQVGLDNPHSIFEGNKQNIRSLARAESGMDVSYALIDAIMKYKHPELYGKKNGAWFASEASIGSDVITVTGTDIYRHPACYLMEAADDIAYLGSDLEDAFKMGILSAGTINMLLANWKAYLVSNEGDTSQVLNPDFDFRLDVRAEQKELERQVHLLASHMAKTMLAHVYEVLNAIIPVCRTGTVAEKIAMLNALPKKLHDQLSENFLLRKQSNPEAKEPLHLLAYDHTDHQIVRCSDFLRFKAQLYNDWILKSPRVYEPENKGKLIIEHIWKALLECIEKDPVKCKAFHFLPESKRQFILRNHGQLKSSVSFRVEHLTHFISGMTDRYAKRFHHYLLGFSR